ncbi:2Fe-2S iron-sulfur cluster-binding protein (plasmid) [Shewanella xiamenensis]|uniref:2Fe-2S iron-sulfur cluster-binding protein n=1 Tax=Shewanella xiamenensis TaxID=332186 RepID=A0ABT6UJ50_9GAMM|nr:2Fe-2S iron-sulfur cluster-binding protein [Shewanella xiamenensis]MDI5833324.1 2Fe-2S iron-sulfur cluster-binding protein [Shewanella xiamenensis]WHF57924.1 2Fe-2S iron-sulfur cluster-binding protein [Shewanella xiamenensis]
MAIVIINGRRFSSSSELVLKILEDHNIEANAMCKAGFCGQCKCSANNPEAVVHKHDVIASLDDGEILPCSAYIKDGYELELNLKI